MKVEGVLRWRTAGLLLAVLVIVLFPYFVTLNNSKETQQAAVWVNHSNAVKALTYQIAYVVRDSESACYRMDVGDGSALTLDREGRLAKLVPGLLQQLRELTRDNPDQQLLLGSLESRINGRIALMNQAMARLQQKDPAGARQSLRDAGDLFALDQQFAAIVQNENGLLQQRQSQAQHQAFNSRLALMLTSLAQLILLGIIVVMSERQIGRRQDAESRESHAVQRSQLILQAVREPIALFDGELRSLVVNAAFAELYGMDDQIGKSLAQIGDGAWRDSVLLQRLKDVLLRNRELWDFDTIQRTADGMTRHVVVNARKLQQQDTGAPALLITVSDVTVRALAEQQVNDLNRQLEGKVEQISDVNRELEAFSYSVSHDLRAPLRHISGFARKLEGHLGERIDDKAQHYIDVMANSAQRMALLIDDLLVFSRLGRGALRLQAVDMQSLVDEARALSEAAVPERHITWVVAPLPMVICDENMLRTVWQNLLGNAVKYTGKTDAARIEISVRQGRHGDYEFTVADNGAGFDMQYADKLFGVFQRLHRASEFPGNGIGLANVRRIIARHGGRVWADAEPGQGARFHFSLPATEMGGAHTEVQA